MLKNYTPGVESLSTVVEGESNNGDVVINGLKDNQMAYHLDEIGNTVMYLLMMTDFDNNEISEEALSYELRPYYHYNNLKLFIPKDIAGKDFLTRNQQFHDPDKMSPTDFDGA
ncbi:hypothetical protein FQA39_LY12982 [Lamprigera yunnana]|nr:hypothetical protein FQA39_LY12982 [Lamprigera yunnana]